MYAVVFLTLLASAPIPQLWGARPSPAVTRAEALMREGRTLLDIGKLLEARATFDNCASRNPADFRCLYDRAAADAWIQKAQSESNHSAEAVHWLDTAIADTLAALGCNNRSANAHAMLGDLYGQKITGMFSGMRYGPKANAEVARAFRLDPRNAMAFAAQGRKYLYAPSAFGGDVDKAIQSFQNATAADPASDDDYVWLAIACRKKGDRLRESEALAQAFRINPGSVFAKRVSEGKE